MEYYIMMILDGILGMANGFVLAVKKTIRGGHGQEKLLRFISDCFSIMTKLYKTIRKRKINLNLNNTNYSSKLVKPFIKHREH